jgi:glucose-6-phosphate isomerase
MNIFKHIQDETLQSQAQEEIFQYKYSNNILEYQSFLRGFNKNLFNLFKSHYEALDVMKSIRSLFQGEIVNKTENQPALHHVYRDIYAPSPNNYASQDLVESCHLNIEKCIQLKEDLIKKGIKNIVTIGIGGSFEGPKLLIETLTSAHNRSFNHIFLTGPDVIEFNETIKPLKQEETFFIVSSKSFSTDETLQSLLLSKKWLESECSFTDHFIAVTSQPDKATKFGFTDNIIEFPNEIGGRYSIWSPISLAAILELGESFKDFLVGGFEADTLLLNDEAYNEFINLICFSDLWHNNFINKHTRVLLIYSWKMRYFSDYAQQLEMESIGKQCNPDALFKNTGQVIFGGFGSTAQHSYFQLLHQGTASICADVFTIEENKDTNKLLFSQSQAQSSLLANGLHEDLELHEQVNGNIPANLFSLKQLNPKTLGFLIATWEHRTFITAKMLQINPFDQYGVSAGKIFAKKYLDQNGG